MSKQEQLIEFIVQDILYYMQREMGLDWKKAMALFFQSITYEKLMDAETGLYRESSAYVFEIFSDELKFGKLLQIES